MRRTRGSRETGGDTATSAVAARAIGASKIYGEGPTEVRALDDVDVTIGAGVFTAVMGPSGSGKSTLVHCLAGLDSLTSGEIQLGGQSLSERSTKELALLRRDQVGFVFQAFNLIPTLTAMENIRLPADLGGYDLDTTWVRTVVDTLGLRDRLSHRPSELSGGEQQRVAIARSLSTRPAIVFADEPTGNLDSAAAAEVLGFLRQVVDEFGQTVVMVTHDPVAAGYSDRVIFLMDGRIAEEIAEPDTEAVLDLMGRLGA